MPVEQPSSASGAGPEIFPSSAWAIDSTEAEMWAAELSFIAENDSSVRSAQFAIRTAVRAQALAALAGTDALNELLDARATASSELSRQVYSTAMTYLRAEQ